MRSGQRRQSRLRRGATTLIDGGRRIQIDLLPLSLDDSGADLGRAFALFVLLVRIVQLLQASGTLRSMGILKAAVETVVAHPVAVAVAGLLMEHRRNLRRQFVGVSLVRILRVRSP